MDRLKWKGNLILLSVVYLILGLFLILRPALTIGLVCGLIGAAVALNGVVQIVRYIRLAQRGFLAHITLWFGILCVAVGGFLLLRGDIVVSILPVLFGLFVVFDSIPRIQNALELRRCQYPNWWSFLLLAALSLGLGVLMLLNPFATVETLVVAIGVILTLEGVLNLFSCLYTALAVRSYEKKHPRDEEIEVEATEVEEPEEAEPGSEETEAAPGSDAPDTGVASEDDGLPEPPKEIVLELPE